jgi:class 3 adenylate cyclase
VRPGGDINDLPGIVFHAHAVAQLLSDRQAPVIHLAGQIAIVVGAAVIGMILGALDISVALRIGAAIAIVVGMFIGGIYLFRWTGVLLPVFAPGATLGLAVWMTGTYIARRDRAQRQFVSTAFSRYLSPRLLEELMDNPDKLKVAAERHELSLIFTDVAGFTTVAEQMDAAELSTVLNRYFDGMVEIVFKHDGYMDKFIGDAVFAIFNAFDDQPDHAQRAVACALELDDFASQFNADQALQGKKFGMTRIGVHTGFASIGNFGSSGRMEFTALGDAVNTAARLEGLNKYFGTHVNVSGAAAQRCPDQTFRPLGQVVLKGKTEAIEVFEPLTEEQAASPYMIDYLRAYTLMSNNSPEAYRVLAELGQANPKDVCVALHLERITAGVGGTRIVMEDK